MGATGLVSLMNPAENHIPLCPLLSFTGLDCAFCGGLRSVHALTQGDLGRAFDHNALFVAFIPLLVIGWLAWLARGVRWPEKARPVLPRAVTAALWVVVLGFAVVRNLPAFEWLGSSL